MSLRINATGDRINRAVSGVSRTAFTLFGVSYLVTDLGSGVAQSIAIFSQSGVQKIARLLFGDFGTTMKLWSDDNGANNSQASFASRPTTGRPFYWCVRCSGSGVGQMNGAWGYTDDAAALVTVTMDQKCSVDADTIDIGNDFAGNDYSDCRHQNIGVFGAAITDAQRAALRYSPDYATTLANLYAYALGNDKTLTPSLADKSGNARNFSSAGSIDIETNLLPEDRLLLLGAA